MAAAAAPRPLSRAHLWWLAARPATLAVSVAAVVAGSASAGHHRPLQAGPMLLALLVALALQVGVNYANDYSDFRRGADTPDRVGPRRAAASGLVPPGQVRTAALAAFALAAIAGLALSLAVDWRLLGVGAVCIAAAWLYTGGPRPYGYHGLGEAFAFVFFGLVATAGSAYVQERALSWLAVLAGVACGLFAAAILALNNLRDLETDRVAAKNTLAVRLGRPRATLLVLILIGAAFLVPPAAAAARLAGTGVLLPLLMLAPAAVVVRDARRRSPAALVAALKNTARLELAFAVLWAAGVLAT